ncbi:MAG: tetratricopeptide repeat protein [Thermoplasmata archaeon]|nr:tetratricopeptide repeat protein [Thermoplasmata archaeon]
MEISIVGREKEIEYFTNAIAQCKSGKGGTYLITGPIGVGKSRLLEELATIGKNQNLAVLFGRGLDEKSVPYLPFTDALSSYSRADEETYTPLALSLTGGEPRGIESVDLTRERGRVLESLSKKILDIESRQPVVLIIDDLQWADTASLSLFIYLARNVSDRKILLLAAYPDEAMRTEKNPVFVNTVMQLRSEKLASVVELKPLTYEAILKLLEIEFGTWKIPEEIAKAIYMRTEGIPLFVTEFVRSIVEENIYDPSKRELRISPEELQMPPTVQSIIKGRLTILSENARKLLTYASICGRVFQYDVLEAITDMDTEAMLDALDELLEKGFIREEGEEKYRFVHNAIYETVFNEIIGVRKRIVHRRIGEALEKLHNTPEYAPEIARHYYNALSYDKAAPYALRSAEDFAKIYATDEAIRYAEMAKFCYEKTGQKGPLMDAALLLGDMLLLNGKYDEAQKVYEEVRKLAEAEANPGKVGVVTARIGLVNHRRGMMNKALEHLMQALEIFEKSGLRVEYARTLRQIGWVYERKGDFAKSLEYVSRGLKLTEELGDPAELADAYHRLGTTQMSIGLMEEAEKNLNMAVEIRKKHNLLKGLADSYNNLGILYHDTGNTERAVEYYLKAKEIYAKIGDVVGESMMSNNLGIIYHDRGEWEKALENYMRDYHTNLKIGNLWGHMISASNIGSLYREMEKYEEALKYYNEALEYSEKIGEKWIYCTALGSVAEIYAIKGEIEKAKELAERCLMVGKSTGSKESLASAFTSIGIVQTYAKNWEEAEEALTNAKLLYAEMKMKSGVAGCDEDLGILYAEKKELEKARKFFEDAIRAFKDLGQVKSVERIEKTMKRYSLSHN